MPFTSPFGGLGLSAFNPASPNLPQNLATKPKATPEMPVPTKPTTPVGADTITALIKPGGLFKSQSQTNTVPEANAPAPMPAFAQPMPMQSVAPTPPLPVFASAPPIAFPGQLPEQPRLPMLPRRINPNRAIFVQV